MIHKKIPWTRINGAVRNLKNSQGSGFQVKVLKGVDNCGKHSTSTCVFLELCDVVEHIKHI